MTKKTKAAVALAVILYVASVATIITVALRGEDTRELGQTTAQNTCSRGNAAACARVCAQLERISDLFCYRRPDPTGASRDVKEVVAGGGNNNPSGQPSPGAEPGPAGNTGNGIGVKAPVPVSICVPPLLNVNDCS